MPTPLKYLYNTQLVKSLSGKIKNQYCDFDNAGFVACVIDEQWEEKELKERMMHISSSLHLFLPMKYSDAIHILMNIASKFNGFQYMFFPGYVELFGLDEYEKSIEALECFTQYSSSEFAVRPFIIKYNQKMMAQMALWAESDNHHVRRLSSEGCRPRLPWAMALPELKKKPGPIMPILEKLKNDESEYVRRSVANNLNDISKDNPFVVMEIARNWFGSNPQTDWVVKHACRTLLKQGNSDAMTLFGFVAPSHIKIKKLTAQRSVKIGDNLDFSFILETKNEKLGKLRIEYALDFVKKFGHWSRKIFKISESNNESNNKIVTKTHSFKIISTRKYYAGKHIITVFVNGQEMAKIGFLLNE